MLTCVGLFGGVQASTQDVTLKLLKDGQALCSTKTTMKSDGSKTPVRVGFEKPVWIPANISHVVTATIKGLYTWSGSREAQEPSDSVAIADPRIQYYNTYNRNVYSH